MSLTYSPDQILLEAEKLLFTLGLGSRFRFDICRHPLAYNPSLWLFPLNSDKQLGSITREANPRTLLDPDAKGVWRANAISHGMPVTQRNCRTLSEAIQFITD